MALGLSSNISELPLCESCIACKHHRIPFSKGLASRASKTLELVHTDLCRPMQKDSIEGFNYFVTFIDNYSSLQLFIF